MSRCIIAVGGTGQAVLDLYLQLYITGTVREAFSAVVIDTDSLNSDLDRIKEFFDRVRLVADRSVGVTGELPTISYVQLKPASTGVVGQQLTGIQTVEDIPRDHPVRAFFSNDSLKQDANKGLKARPALSTVAVGRMLAQVPSFVPENASSVVIVGSLVGGTAGGLMAPIVTTVTRRLQAGRLRAVLFGDYFKANEKLIDADRLKSNLQFGLMAFREISSLIDAFVIVGDGDREYLEDRDHEAEKRQALAWPTREDHPFWRGVQAVHALLSASPRDMRPEFAEGELDTVTAGTFSKLILPVARQHLEEGLGTAAALKRHQVIHRMAGDPYARAVWESPLTQLVADLWSVSARLSTGAAHSRFCDDVQAQIDLLWSGDLRQVFPAAAREAEPTLRQFRRQLWPRVAADQVDDEFVRAQKDQTERSAANLLLCALRRGATHAS